MGSVNTHGRFPIKKIKGSFRFRRYNLCSERNPFVAFLSSKFRGRRIHRAVTNHAPDTATHPAPTLYARVHVGRKYVMDPVFALVLIAILVGVNQFQILTDNTNNVASFDSSPPVEVRPGLRLPASSIRYALPIVQHQTTDESTDYSPSWEIDEEATPSVELFPVTYHPPAKPSLPPAILGPAHE